MAYKRAVEKFESLASKYFDGAAKEGSEAERAEKVAKIRRHINAGKVPVTDAISKMEEQVSREIFGEQRKLLNGLNPKQSPYLDVFFGEKYKDQRTRTASQYSLERSAGVSVAIFALFNTGKYSFDDIMDPEKLQAEKRAMFDEVAQRMLNPTSENQEWLARTIYEGQKNTERAIDEQAKQVDFSTVDIATDKRFCQMLHLASAQFDAWQEMSHCQDEITKIANAERPEIKSYKDYYDWWTDRRGPLGLINDALGKIEEYAIDLVTNPDSVEEPLRNVVGEYVSMKNYMQAISEAMITGEKSFTESLSGDRILEEREKNLYIGEQIGKYSKKFKGLYYAARDVLDSVVSDTYLFGKEIVVDLEAGKAELKGFPGPEELKRRNQLVKADSIQAATRFENIGKDAKAATVGVYFGSKQYSDAMRDIDKVHVAFKELQEIENKRIDAANNSETQEDILQEIERQKEAKKTEIRGLMSNAKKSIEKYFDRKRKRGEMGPKADAKSKRRIGVMQDAMSAIEEYTLQLDAEDMVDENEKMLSSSDTVEPEFENLQQVFVDTRKSEYMSKLTDAVGIDRIAKKGALQAISTLEELTNLGSEFGTKEIRTARIAMAAMVFDEMMSGPEGDKIRENMSGDLKTYKAQVTKIADSKEFKDVMPKNLSREGIRDFLIYESKAKELLDSFKVKTAETAAKKQNEPEKGRKSVATQQKPENEPAQRKRSNSVSVKMTAKIP